MVNVYRHEIVVFADNQLRGWGDPMASSEHLRSMLIGEVNIPKFIIFESSQCFDMLGDTRRSIC